MAREPRESWKERAASQAWGLAQPFGIAVGAIILWHLWVRSWNVPVAILPSPRVVWEILVDRWPLLLQHTWPTTWQGVAGFLLAVVVGVGLGILISLFRFFREGVYPLIVAFQVIPKVALAPLFILWFGLGFQSRLLLAFFIAFFPMVVNTFAGLESTEEDMIRMARAFHASRWQIFRKIQFPNALPYIFSGLKISITFSVIGIIVAEFVTAQEGLGYLIVFSEGNVDTPMLMAALFILSVVGLLLYGAMVLIEKLAIRWDTGQGA